MHWKKAQRIGELEKIDNYYYFLVFFRECSYLVLIPCSILESIWQMHKSNL